MLKRRFWSIAAIILFCAGTATLVFADVAPEAGYTRVYSSIVLETNDDLSLYRFFLVSGDLVKEVFPKAGEQTAVSSPGGGARYNSGTIVAIPRKELAVYGDDPAGDRLAARNRDISAFSVGGEAKLATQTFGRDVPTAEANDQRDTRYRLEKTSNGVSAVDISSTADKPSNRSGNLDGPAAASNWSWINIISGLLISAAIAAAGLGLFLRFFRRTA